MTLPSLEPSTRSVTACKKPIRTWKRSGRSCPTGNRKQSAGGNPWGGSPSFTPGSRIRALAALRVVRSRNEVERGEQRDGIGLSGVQGRQRSLLASRAASLACGAFDSQDDSDELGRG